MVYCGMEGTPYRVLCVAAVEALRFFFLGRSCAGGGGYAAILFLLFSSAAGDGLTNIMENPTFVGPRAHYLRLLRRRRRYEPQYYSVLRLCSAFRESRSFLCLNIKKSIHG